MAYGKGNEKPDRHKLFHSRPISLTSHAQRWAFHHRHDAIFVLMIWMQSMEEIERVLAKAERSMNQLKCKLAAETQCLG